MVSFKTERKECHVFSVCSQLFWINMLLICVSSHSIGLDMPWNVVFQKADTDPSCLLCLSQAPHYAQNQWICLTESEYILARNTYIYTYGCYTWALLCSFSKSVHVFTKATNVLAQNLEILPYVLCWLESHLIISIFSCSSSKSVHMFTEATNVLAQSLEVSPYVLCRLESHSIISNSSYSSPNQIEVAITSDVLVCKIDRMSTRTKIPAQKILHKNYVFCVVTRNLCISEILAEALHVYSYFWPSL